MNRSTSQAIILRRINYGEADRILTVLTPNHGKISIIAKGVRKSKSKLAGGLELFCVTNIGYINGRSDLKTTISTRLERNYSNIVKNYDLTMLAYDFMKLIDSSTKESCGPEYFNLLDNGLKSLNEHASSANLIRVWFMTQLLSLAGTGINLDTQQDGSNFDESKKYQFNFDNMVFFTHNTGEYLPKHIKFMRLLRKVSKPENLLKVGDVSELSYDIRPLLEYCVRLQ
jgi:DNA repair protein RecO (recombination protein O)